MLVLEIHDGSGIRHASYDAEQIRIGRDPDCEVRLVGDPTVSRFHALISQTSEGPVAQDLDSANGTFLQQGPLDQPYLLAAGSRLSIGTCVVVLVRADEDERAIETLPSDQADDARLRLGTGLSSRELEILRLICTARTDQQIADELCISVKTVQSHLDRIRDKTGCRRRPELIRFSHEHGIA